MPHAFVVAYTTGISFVSSGLSLSRVIIQRDASMSDFSSADKTAIAPQASSGRIGQEQSESRADTRKKMRPECIVRIRSIPRGR